MIYTVSVFWRGRTKTDLAKVYEEEKIFEQSGQVGRTMTKEYIREAKSAIPLDRNASRINWPDDDPDLTIAKIASCWGGSFMLLELDDLYGDLLIAGRPSGNKTLMER